MLFYFRFPEVYYSVPRIGVVALDALALLRAAVDDDAHGSMKSSAAVNELQGAIERRTEWDAHIRSVAATLGFAMADVDPAADAAGRLADAAKSGRA